MKLSVKNAQGQSSGELEVKFAMIENGKGTQAVHDTVVAHRANQRSGTACTKNVGDVSGSNKKPWRQKGTGRARAGSNQSPLWPGGGVVFGPKPRDFGKKVNVRTRQLALRKALSERLKAGDVVVVDDLKLATPKTKEFIGVIAALELTGHHADRGQRGGQESPARVAQSSRMWRSPRANHSTPMTFSAPTSCSSPAARLRRWKPA